VHRQRVRAGPRLGEGRRGRRPGVGQRGQRIHAGTVGTDAALRLTARLPRLGMTLRAGDVSRGGRGLRRPRGVRRQQVALLVPLSDAALTAGPVMPISLAPRRHASHNRRRAATTSSIQGAPPCLCCGRRAILRP
jgi:hypothetical protein